MTDLVRVPPSEPRGWQSTDPCPSCRWTRNTENQLISPSYQFSHHHRHKAQEKRQVSQSWVISCPRSPAPAGCYDAMSKKSRTWDVLAAVLSPMFHSPPALTQRRPRLFALWTTNIKLLNLGNDRCCVRSLFVSLSTPKWISASGGSATWGMRVSHT